jgi:hypothetical protein
VALQACLGIAPPQDEPGAAAATEAGDDGEVDAPKKEKGRKQPAK